MSTPGSVPGTPFPSHGKRQKDRVAHPEDIYDLALAGARFVLDLEARDDTHRHGSDRARAEIATTARSLSARRTLRGLSPVWTLAATSLIRGDRITAEALDAILKERQAGESMGQLLLRRTAIPEGAVAEAIARATSAPLIQLTTYPVHGEPFRSVGDAIAAPKHAVLVDELAARRIPHELETRHDMILVAAWEGEGVLAMVDPGDESAVWEAQEATGLRLTRFTALASQLRLSIERCWQPRPDVDVPATGRPHDAVPFVTAVGVPALALVATFLFVFRDALNLRHHFALMALAIGIFFFTYALRYYITTAAVIGIVLFGDRLRRQRILSRIRSTKELDPRKLSLAALAATGGGAAAHQNYRTLRGEQLDDIGAIIADPERIGTHRLPREEQPFVSIQLAMYNERHVVERLLRACTSFDYDNYEVIVADDSTDPQALAILDKWSSHPRVRILHRGTRKGFKGGALQEALKRMDERTEYVMIFDADFIPPPDAIWHFLDYFGRLPGPNGETADGHAGGLRGVADGVPANGDRLAAVQGYQWHMLNASENWITKGIRTEFSGSYVLERAAQELFGTMKMISGSVYMIRADVLRRLGWSTSITEDWELTIRLYLAGYKVLYTPYIQAPSECVSELKQLIRQRKRWARGHTFNVKKYFFSVLRSPNMSWREKFEFLYYAPYYLQSILFLAGTVAWVVGIFMLDQKLPQWGETLGWSLVVSNVLALPLMNLAGLILEGSVKRDLVGLGSFIGLSTLLVPFQGWAALRGLLEPTEGGWDRTPKSGRITESLATFRLGKVLPWELPKRGKLSTRAAHILVTCVAGMLAGAIVGIGALSMRAAASTGKVNEGDLLLPFVFGTLIPLAVVGYGWFRLHRRIAVCVLAAAIGLSSNVVFLATTVPANATAGLTSTFMFRNATAFQPPYKDMEQGYTPAGAASQTPGTSSANWTATFASDTFTSTMSLNAGSATVDLYGENVAGSAPAFRNASSAWSLGISYVAATAQVVSTTSSASLTPGLPTGWAVDDLAILVVAGRPTNANEPTPTGWTLRTSRLREMGATDLKIMTFYRVLQTGDSGPTVTLPASGWTNGMSAQVLAWRGVDTTTPFDVADQAADAAAADPWAAVPAITTVTDMSWVVSAVASSDNNDLRVGTANGFTSPALIGGINYDTTFGADHAVGVTDYLKAVPGATTMLTWDQFANGSDQWVGITFALRPAQYLTIAKPTNTAQNDVMIAALAARSTNVTVTAPSGWNPIRQTTTAGGTAHILWTFYKVAGASEPASYTFTVTNYHSMAGGIQAFSGVDTGSLTSLLENGQSTASATTHDTPSISTTRPNAMIVTNHTTSVQNGTWTPPTGMGDAYDTPGGAGTGHMTLQGSYVAQAAAAATGAKQATSTGTNTGTTHILALYPTPNSCTVTATLKHVVPSTTIALVGATQNSIPSGGGALTLSVPGGTADNDTMIAVVAVRPDTATITAPGAWTPVRTMTQTGATQHKVVVYRRLASSEPASYDFTIDATSTGAAGGVMTFSGVDTSNPVDIDNGQLTASGTAHNTPSVTTTVIDTMLVATFAFSTSATWTEGSAMGEAIDVASETVPSATGISVASYYQLQATAGATGAKTGTASNDADVGSTHILALKPATVGSYTSLGSGTGSFSSATATLTQITFATSAVSAFADGDRLHLDVTVPNDATNCSARLHYDGASAQSKLVTATIVPEGVLGLLLIAPLLPVAMRRRWIPVPGFGRRERGPR